MKKTIFFILLLFLFSVVSYGQSWMGKILPIQTNISDLSKIINAKPNRILDDQLIFNLKEGNLFIWFSKGNCISGSWGAWDVKEGTVISIVFYPRKERKPSFYKLSKNGMSKDFNQGHIIYKSIEEGLSFSTEFGKVRGITYLPRNNNANLRCKI